MLATIARVLRGRAGAVLSLFVAAGSFCAAWYVVSDRYAVRTDSDARFGLGVVPWNQPEEATDFLLRSGASPQLFHAMEDGSYLDWAAHERFPVFIDGRNEVFGEAFIAEYLSLTNGQRDWDSFAARWGIETAMLHGEQMGPLVEILRQSAGWILVHVDARELVFVHDIPRHADLIRKHRFDPKAPWSPPGGGRPRETPAGWRTWIGALGRPWYSLGAARTLLLAGALDPAAAQLEHALREFPGNREARALLAQIYRSRGRAAEADGLLAGLRYSEEERRRMDDLLATLMTLQGDPAGAVEALLRLLSARPQDAQLRGRLARAYFEAGDYPRAREAYRRALERAPSNGPLWMELGHACAQNHDDQGAIEAYRSAVRFAPALFQAQYNLGVLLARRGAWREAADHFRQALHIKPGDQQAQSGLAQLESAFGADAPH